MRPHELVAEALRSRIRTGVWQNGEMIPGRRRLAEDHGVALTTVERAVAALIAEGILRADDRRGTFVTSDPPPGNSGSAATTTSGALATGPLVATVGIISNVVPYDSPDLRANQWTARIVSACEHRLSAERDVSQHFFNLSSADGPATTLRQLAPRLAAERLDAVICLGLGGLKELQAITGNPDLPVVVGSFDAIEALLPHVYIDNTAGGVLAARHLRSRGFAPVTFLRPFAASWADLRLAGARAELGADSVAVWPPELPTAAEWGQAEDQRALTRKLMRDLLATDFTPGMGVIAANDSIATGFMDAAAARGLEAGRDYGLVGFDDWERDAHITSLRPPLEQLGEEAARMAVMLLRGEVCPTRVALPPRLIARTSTRAADGSEQ